ncbi:MAG: cysteine dioxygenase [Gammaproteobacteria bacterium]|nr:cysteine dioxygenase [Gammaproteobacteria bacterium]MBU1442519.1 cysteine dioxygenase [Gammaproteobacteria bacterium]MBU2410340.1 cysteine dioxygenase [Gammaproteobacteria bacterium]
MSRNASRFTAFIDKFTQLVDQSVDDEPAILAAGRPLLQELVSHDDWLPESCAQPDPQYYRQYLLHADPEDRYAVVSFVWGPGQKTPVHDHTVWALIGMLRGAECSERFALSAAGMPMVAQGVEMLRPGDVDAVSPRLGDIHRVSNGHDDRVSISVHVYGGNIGRIARHVFDPQTGAAKTFVSGYSNETGHASGAS